MPSYGSGIKLSIITNDDFNKTIENMRSLGKVISYEAVNAVAEGSAALFATAQELVPVDTGELRESGTLTLSVGNKSEIIGTGNEDGSVDVDLSGVTKQHFRKKNIERDIRVEISYYRMSSRGKDDSAFPKGTFDVAVFTHEHLDPAPGAQAQARREGQGKYLEAAYFVHKNEIINMIRAVVKDTDKVKKYIKITKPKGKFTVEGADISFR